MNYTENYQLPQWVETDRVLMEDFNAANSTIDRILGEHTEVLASCGNCKVYFTSYTGNGSSSRTHTFPDPPLAVLISGPNIHLTAVNPCTEVPSANSTQNVKLNTSWNGNYLTISYSGSYAGGDQKALNESGTTYYMVALTSA